MSLLAWLTAKLYDKSMRDAEAKCLQNWRATLLNHASGAVLEIGSGTGSNIKHYPDTITKLVLLEPNPHMCNQLKLKLPANSSYPIELLGGNAESLPFPDASFNTVVSTLVLCSVKNSEKTLSELHRVLVPEGRLIFIEHVAASPDTSRRKWQHRIEPIWKIIFSGCHLTRQTEEAITRTGFVIEEITRQSMRGVPPVARPSIRGVAVKSAHTAS